MFINVYNLIKIEWDIKVQAKSTHVCCNVKYEQISILVQQFTASCYM